MIARRILLVSGLLALVACGAVPASNPSVEADPILPLLSDLDVADDAESVTLSAPVESNETTGSLLRRLVTLRRQAPPSAVDLALAEAVAPSDDAAPQDDLTVAETAADPAPQQDPITVAAQTPTQRGLLGRIFNASAGTSAPAAATAPAASVPSNQIPPDTIMAFGAIGPTCGLSRRDLGTRIAAASGYEIYDTIPNSTAPRPHYITGFTDGCARQFTAALVLLGDVGTHEVVRYSRTAVDLDYSDTDNAYEAIKSSFCRVGFGKPCGARLERLANRTTFVTAYERFGAGPIWAEFLLHDGDVAASDIEGE